MTGPVLLYDESLYVFCLSHLPGLFLPWRFWIGLWTFVIALLVAAFEGSTLVRFFTKFTKDIFAGLVALLFIYEAFNKLGKIFKAHPLLETLQYCQAAEEDSCIDGASCQPTMQPNIALLSLILMFSTFIIAYALKVFRNSQFLERRFRRALGDFGVPIAIAAMLLVDWAAGDSITEKLNIPNGIQVTETNIWLGSIFECLQMDFYSHLPGDQQQRKELADLSQWKSRSPVASLGNVCRNHPSHPPLPPHLHGDPDLRADHHGEDQGGKGGWSSSGYCPLVSHQLLLQSCWGTLGLRCNGNCNCS